MPIKLVIAVALVFMLLISQAMSLSSIEIGEELHYAFQHDGHPWLSTGREGIFHCGLGLGLDRTPLPGIGHTVQKDDLRRIRTGHGLVWDQ